MDEFDFDLEEQIILEQQQFEDDFEHHLLEENSGDGLLQNKSDSSKSLIVSPAIQVASASTVNIPQGTTENSNISGKFLLGS